MCEWGDTVDVRVLIPVKHSATGRDEWRVKAIDRCIAPVVEALQAPGAGTEYSCCGHGRFLGGIGLRDGRVLLIADRFAYYHPWILAVRWVRWRVRGILHPGPHDAP